MLSRVGGDVPCGSWMRCYSNVSCSVDMANQQRSMAISIASSRCQLFYHKIHAEIFVVVFQLFKPTYGAR